MIRLFKKLFGTSNTRALKRMQRTVDRINSLAEDISALSDAELTSRAQDLKAEYKRNDNLEALLSEAFALAREAAERANGTRPYDVQLQGAIALHEGNIAEMRTGEGKTLVAVLPAFLNALTGRPVHIVTVNDYLARRDADWMGPIYNMLGLSVGVIQVGQEAEAKKTAYQADVTYGTNNEFGFDFLRDNMAFRLEDKVQRGHYFAIVDEVDSILIDEARTPLIITGPAEQSTELYQKINRVIPLLKRQEKVESTIPEVLGGETQVETGDFFVDEQHRNVELTNRGYETVEAHLRKQKMLAEDENLYDAQNVKLLHHVTAAVKANFLYKRDVDYMVQDGEVVIIDEHTGRAMVGRRWSEGIHQAIEAKEKLAIRQETQTYASTTFQNYFRIYDRLSGMTGTAETESTEFSQTYGLAVRVIPTHMPMIRDDRNDLLFMTEDEKYDAIVEDINDCRDARRPVLVGTTSIESSERLSRALKKRKIEHSVLNAKQHEKEAEIVAQAGIPGAVTIATNMAGRGTDIVLGGNWQAEVQGLGQDADANAVSEIKTHWDDRNATVLGAGGLHIIGTERHESRRIDNQLRGRAGRQGDPGSSRFYLSLDDNLLRVFGTERWRETMRRLFGSAAPGEAIEAKMFNNAVEKSQRKIEGRNFDIRKNLLEYDDVANHQRLFVYQQRDELMSGEDIQETLRDMREKIVTDTIDTYVPPQTIPEQWDVAGLEQALQRDFDALARVGSWIESESIATEEDLRARVIDEVHRSYANKRLSWIEDGLPADAVEHQVMLSIYDQKWKEHLQNMDNLRQGIHLRAYAQKNPKHEYKREAFELFQEMLYQMNRSVTMTLCRMRVRQGEDAQEVELRRRRDQAQRMQFNHPNAADGAPQQAKRPQKKVETFKREQRKVGRNEPCPCGSGKKYKLCHGRAAVAQNA